jgi:hypothetical protein
MPLPDYGRILFAFIPAKREKFPGFAIQKIAGNRTRLRDTGSSPEDGLYFFYYELLAWEETGT